MLILNWECTKYMKRHLVYLLKDKFSYKLYTIKAIYITFALFLF